MLADALVLAAHVPREVRVVDVGTGAGAPGLALAFARDDLQVTLVEPLGKRVSFLRTVLGAAGRTDVRIERGRGDAVAGRGAFDVAVSRATLAPAAWLGLGTDLVVPGDKSGRCSRTTPRRATLALLSSTSTPTPGPSQRRSEGRSSTGSNKTSPPALARIAAATAVDLRRCPNRGHAGGGLGVRFCWPCQSRRASRRSMSGIRESELTSLRKLAEEMAKGRGERATTGHLLAAIAAGNGGAADLLRERRLDSEVLLKAARVLTDDHADAVSRAMQRARELAARSPVREVGGRTSSTRSARSGRRPHTGRSPSAGRT